MGTTTIRKQPLDLKPGDVIRFLGHDHVFSYFRDPSPASADAFHALNGRDAKIAVATDEWSITAVATPYLFLDVVEAP